MLLLYENKWQVCFSERLKQGKMTTYKINSDIGQRETKLMYVGRDIKMPGKVLGD